MPLADPATGALLRRGIEIDLHIGIGKHHGADVAASEDDAAISGEVTLALQQLGPEPGLTRHERDGAVHHGSVHGHVAVRTVHEDVREAPLAVVGERNPRHEPDKALNIFGVNALGKRKRRHGPVEQTRVHKPQAETS